MSHNDTVHFVTHSLGGIILRYYLESTYIDNKVGRIVMLCPPNQGSSLSDSLHKHLNVIFRLLMGPAGQELVTCNGVAGSLKKTYPAIGIIAGDKSFEPWFVGYLKSANDGKVLVDETKMKNMADFIVLHHTHTFMMNAADTHKQILSFLKTGKFAKSE